MKYIIGTRGSRLALTQTTYVKQMLEQAYPEDSFEIKIIKTTGDKDQKSSLSQMGTKGVFVKEIEEELLDGRIHMAVHSMKDMPSKLPEGLVFAKSLKREDSRDVLILREADSLETLKSGAVIGTGSSRRALQLKQLRPDITCKDIRGNVDTRLRKMEEQKLDGIVLAAAGLNRLGMNIKHKAVLSFDQMIPAPAQGILAIEVNQSQEELLDKINRLGDDDTEVQKRAERGYLEAIGGDCHTAIGAVCTKLEDGRYLLRALSQIPSSKDLKDKKIYITEGIGNNPENLAAEVAKQMRRKVAGTVALVGAGPGNPSLITVRGMELIRQADCIVYDRLIPMELLNECKPDCECIYVGKENHNHAMIQPEINELLIKKSMEYPLTVRLKGGDPYVFGRGGEEGLACDLAGVTFEEVPGISSSIAGLAFAGIPITHRGISTGFHVITAHNKRDELADLDFHQIAKRKETWVLLMGLNKLSEIVSGLLQAGAGKDSQIAVISKATTSNQKSCVGTLENIVQKVEEEHIQSPALIIYGEVISLRESLNFFEDKKLFGKQMMVAKIGRQVSDLTRNFRELGANVEEIQLGEICSISIAEQIERINQCDNLVFTSKHGVHFFFEQYLKKQDIRALFGKKIYVVGSKTRDALNSYGIFAENDEFFAGSKEMGTYLETHAEKDSKLIHITARVSENVWNTDLKKTRPDLEIETVAVYENVKIHTSIDAKKMADADAFVFTCASMAERFFEQIPENQRADYNNYRCFAIGKKTAEKLQKYGITHVHVSDQTDYQSLTEKVIACIR